MSRAMPTEAKPMTKRDPGAEDDPGQQIAAQVVGAQEVVDARGRRSPPCSPGSWGS